MLLWLLLPVSVSGSCYSRLSSPYLLTATKTGYSPVQNEDTSPVTAPGCSGPQSGQTRLTDFQLPQCFTFIVSKTSHFPLPIQSLQSRGDVQCGCWRGTGRGTRAGRRWCRWRGCSPRSGTRSSPTTGRVSAAAAVRRGVMCSLVRPGRALRRGRGQPRPVEIQADRGGRIHAHGVGGKRHVGARAKLSCSKYALDR